MLKSTIFAIVASVFVTPAIADFKTDLASELGVDPDRFTRGELIHIAEETGFQRQQRLAAVEANHRGRAEVIKELLAMGVSQAQFDAYLSSSD